MTCVEKRHEHLPQLRLQHVVEELERIGADDRVRRAEADVGVVETRLREEQRHQPEDALQLLLHRVPQRLQHRIVAFELCPQRTEHLIRAVVADDLRRQQQLDDRRIDAGRRGCGHAQLVQRDDDAVPERGVRVQQALDQRLLGLARADAHQHRRQLAAHLDGDALVA